MNDLTVFNFESNDVRVIDQNGEPWFVAKDVCKVLGISNHRDAISRLDADEKGVSLTDTLGGSQQTSIINESGLYTIVLRCRDATTAGTVPHRFRKWVTSEVLPSIRKTGYYSAPSISYDAAKYTAELSPPFVAMAKSFGFEGNQASYYADRAIQNVTGISPLALMECTLTDAKKAQTYTPTELGAMMEPVLSARKVNKLLHGKGLQTPAANNKWEPTEQGQPFCEVSVVNKQHSDGAPVKQVKWYGSVLDYINGHAMSE